MLRDYIKSKHISKLDLSNKGLNEIPEEVFRLKNLKRLNLSNNKISRVPKEIENLKALRTLDLSKNRIKNFYSKICTLQDLRRLNLNDNEIRTIPKQISFLKNLRALSVARNKLDSLPEEMKGLVDLRKLNISQNKFKKGFPYVLFEIESLKYIWLNKIPFEKFPMNFLLQENLKGIYFYGKVSKEDTNIDANYLQLSRIRGNLFKSDTYDWKNKAYQRRDNAAAVARAFNANNKAEHHLEEQNHITEKKPRAKIFISYAHKDSRWLEEIKAHLKVLQYQGIDIDVWDDRRIMTGMKWKEEIEIALGEAKIAILVVSTYFLGSDFIQNNELPELLKNAEKKGTAIFPIIARPCRFKNDDRINSFQAVNSPSEPLNSLSEPRREEILVKLSDDVERHLKQKPKS